MTTPTPTPDPVVSLHLDEADDLAHLLGRVEDWLRHAGGDTHADLIEFLGGPGNGRLAVAGLLDALGGHAATLARRRRAISSGEATR
jgi:hypothetical protein